MRSPEISVIVPVYNGGRWLDKCIKSILCQTFTNFELILVDDGSNDNTSEICLNFVERDSRIRYFSKANGGVSSARNVGLDNSKGKWLTFIDADDWIEPCFFENFIHFANDDCSLLFSGHVNHFANGKTEIVANNLYRVDRSNFEIVYCECNIYGRTSPWGKLFRRSVIEKLGLRFDERMRIGEDALFLYNVILAIDSFLMIPHHDYNYNYETDGSLTKKVYDVEQEFYFQSRITYISDKLTQRFSLSSDESRKRLGWTCGYYVGRVINSLYHTKGISLKTRLQILNNIDVNSYVTYLKATRIKEYILFFLLRNRMFRIYDGIRCLNNML